MRLSSFIDLLRIRRGSRNDCRGGLRSGRLSPWGGRAWGYSGRSSNFRISWRAVRQRTGKPPCAPCYSGAMIASACSPLVQVAARHRLRWHLAKPRLCVRSVNFGLGPQGPQSRVQSVNFTIQGRRRPRCYGPSAKRETCVRSVNFTIQRCISAGKPNAARHARTCVRCVNLPGSQRVALPRREKQFASAAKPVIGQRESPGFQKGQIHEILCRYC